MKSIFLIALVFLVTNWPTPSASWSLNQKYADSANTYAQQQGYDSPLGSSKLMNNGFRLNPELFVSNEDRRAFSRTVGSANGRSRKLSSTRFNLKPIERVVVDDDEEFIADQEQQFEAPQQQQVVIPQQQEVQQKEQKTESLTSMDQLAQESAKRLSEQKQEAAKEAIKETVKETVKEAAIKQEAKQDVKQDIKEEIKQEVKQDAKEEIKQDVVAAAAEIIKEKAAVAEESEKVESIKPLNYKAAPIQRQQPLQQQQQIRPIMSSQWQQKQQQQQQLQQQQPDQLRFQIGQADNVNTVDLNFVKNEAIRTMNFRNLNPSPLSYGAGGAKYNQQPSFYPKEAIRRPENNYKNEREQPRYDDRDRYDNDRDRYENDGGDRYDNDRDRDNSVGDLAKSIGNNVGGLAKEIQKDAKKVMKGFDTIQGTFSSLIIIANSNANANLGVSSIDVDLLKSFLSTYFLGKSVDYLLKDEDLAKLVEKFNAEHLKNSYSSSDDKKYGQYESTSKLSANSPVFSNVHEKAAPKAGEKADAKPSNSITENTVIVKKEDESVNLNYSPRVNPIPGGGGYYYLPSPKGSIIVVNNVNENLNDRVKAILSGKDYNLSEYNAGMILPLDKHQINTLMRNAIIVNNGNKNKNRY